MHWTAGNVSADTLSSNYSLQYLAARSNNRDRIKVTLENKVLNPLILNGQGWSAPELLVQLRPRISQPTLWRWLDTLRTQEIHHPQR